MTMRHGIQTPGLIAISVTSATKVQNHYPASGTRNSYHFEILCPQGNQSKGYALHNYCRAGRSRNDWQVCVVLISKWRIWYSENGSASDCLAMHKPVEQKYR